MKFKTYIEKKDTEEIITSKYINWDYYKNSTILVTGATGLIGSQIIKSILYANETQETNINILALVRNIRKAKSLFAIQHNNFFKSNKLKYVVQDITKKIDISEKIDFIIHTANTTSSKDFVEQPVETINTIINGTKNILELAKKADVKSIVYLSSMEVYGKTDFNRTTPLKESDYGYIELMNVRNSYPEGKRLAECLCYSYSKEYNLPLKIARLSQTIGAGVDYNDNKVFAQFARNIAERKDIILKTAGESIRSYCYITDVVTAIFALLERGKNGDTYNVANSDTTCSIKQMAEMLCGKYPNTKLKIELDDKYYPEPSKLYLDTTKIKSDTDWQANISLGEMFDRIIQSFYSRPNIIKTNNNFYCNNKPETINIALAADNNYAPHLAAAIASILQNSDKYSKLDFYILSNDLTEYNIRKINKLKNIKDCTINYINMNQYDWSKFPLNRKHISVATYYRLALLDILPKNIEKVIYLDCDVIAESNIRELWDYDINDYLAGVVEDVTGIREAKRLKLPSSNYFNAGVLLLNIKRLREFDFFNKCNEFFVSNKDIIRLQDQDILNNVLNDKCLFLPLNWNVNTRIYAQNNNNGFHNYSVQDEWHAKYFPKIIHFSDKYKPWHRQCIHVLKDEYYKYLKLTDFNKEKLLYRVNSILSYIFAIQSNFDIFQIKLLNIPIYFIQKGKIKNIYLFGIKIYTKIKDEKQT